MNLGKDTKLIRVSNAVAAGTTAINCDVVDLAGYSGIMYVVAFGAITASAVTSIKAQQATDDTPSDAADLEGTSVAVADTDDDKLFYLDIFGQAERYSRLVISRGTANAVVDGVIGILYKGKKKPSVHCTTTVGGGEVHAGMGEGTA